MINIMLLLVTRPAHHSCMFPTMYTNTTPTAQHTPITNHTILSIPRVIPVREEKLNLTDKKPFCNEISEPYEVPQFPIEQIEKKLQIQQKLNEL